MSAGSAASNLGYGNIYPYNNSPYVNGTSSNYSGSFSSNEIPGTPPGPLPGLAGAKYNVDAAAGRVPGICMNGGAKKIKRKIKNITKQYKRMKAGSKKMRSIKHKLRSRAMSRTLARQSAGKRRKSSRKTRKSGRKTRKYRRQRGGYAQYQNNLPLTPTYQVAGINLPSNQLALANPPPIRVLPNTGECTDNYNHYTNQGFPSKGH
jgi:hypothetical protein